ncbi:hypothetical protein RJ639_026539 [Escallonia herrerae]|uniref:Protein kinase domain-containing protein n=1 Tax=Escallonia herrerae TaxID=1293975 RepID=A0AA89ABP4_9ASTE|nr:hypothetical protein RJ639_026539 [Escallonia herrerae]
MACDWKYGLSFLADVTRARATLSIRGGYPESSLGGVNSSEHGPEVGLREVGSLLNQGPTAFSGNPNLCGFPLQTPCPEPEAQNPRVFSNPENPKNLNSANGFAERDKVRSGSVTVPLISGVSVVVGVVFVSVWAYRKKWRFMEGNNGKEKLGGNDVSVTQVSEEGQKGKFVALDEGFGLELEDLLRASAYVVGKSRSGIVYRVVAGTGSGGAGAVVAIDLLKRGKSMALKQSFHGHVQNTLSVPHCASGPANTLPPLSWAARWKIARGTARGLMHIHECSPRKYAHGNIKSSKILLDDDLQPYISGFGLSRLVSGASKSTNAAFKKQNSTQVIVSPKYSASSSVVYMAPEARVSGSKFTQKSDVYSFGIVLLEILTARLPDGGPDNEGKCLESLVRKVFRDERPLSEIIDPALLHEVHAKTQVIAMFHIALNCTELDPEVRPRMRMVSESLERIKSQ